MGLAVTLHLLAVLFWVGGMSFAYLMLRPAAGPLEPAARLGLWNRIFGRFLPSVAAAILVILATGFYMWLGLGVRGPHVHAMAGLGIVMMLLFAHMWAAPFRRFRRAVEAGDNPAAAKQLNQIRIIVLINLLLGTLTVIVAAWGRSW